MRKVVMISLVLTLILALVGCGTTSPTSSEGNNTSTDTTKTDTSGSDVKAFTYPEKPLNWTIAFGPGGGNDIMSRTIIDILQKYELYTQPILAENRKGGSGAVGWGYLNSQRGNPYHISSTSGSFITTPLNSDPGFNYESFTPVALIAADDLVFLVHADSEYNTLEEFIAAAKGGKKVSIGGIGAVNVDSMVPRMLAEVAGFDFEYVPFQGDGENTTALLSKSIDAMMANPAEVLGQLEAGKMKALAFSGTKRIQQLPDVPTLIELGYDVTLSMPRGVILAGDVPKEVQDWWIETMKKVAETPEWKAYIKDNSLTEYLLFGEDFKNYLAKTSETFERILKEQGTIK